MAYEGTTTRHANGKLDWTGHLNMIEDRLLEPLSWGKPRRVFVNSMSDMFHEDVPDAFIDKVFAVMALAPLHTFQVLTKRADRMRAYFNDYRHVDVANAAQALHTRTQPHTLPDERVIWWQPTADGTSWHMQYWPLKNVWLGVSVENQQYADERIPLLLQTPAAVRFISAEPLLGPLDFGLNLGVPLADGSRWSGSLPCLDWVIVGGESGSRARPFDLAWARSIVRQCKAAGVACFVKQVGSWPFIPCPSCKGVEADGFCGRCGGCHRQAYRGSNGKGGDPSEWPEDLRVREFPAVTQ
jgi:protein gp37